MKNNNLIYTLFLILFFICSKKSNAQIEGLFAIQKFIRISNYKPVSISNKRRFTKDQTKKELHNNGKTQYEFTIKDKNIHGIVKEYYENGDLKLEGTYVRNVKDGIHKTYYKGNKQESISEFDNGKLINATIFFSNGKIKHKTSLTKDKKKNELRNLKTFFSSDKKTMKVGTINLTSKKQTTSDHTSAEKYFLKTENNYKNERLFGEQKEYNDKGKLKRIMYCDSKKIYKAVFFNNEGKVDIEKKYKTKSFSRDWKFYYSNGTLKSRYSEDYKDNAIDSIFFKTGELNKVINIDENTGRMIAKKEFYANGNLKTNYKLGKKKKHVIMHSTFYENGNKKCVLNSDAIAFNCYDINGKLKQPK